MISKTNRKRALGAAVVVSMIVPSVGHAFGVKNCFMDGDKPRLNRCGIALTLGVVAVAAAVKGAHWAYQNMFGEGAKTRKAENALKAVKKAADAMHNGDSKKSSLKDIAKPYLSYADAGDSYAAMLPLAIASFEEAPQSDLRYAQLCGCIKKCMKQFK